MARPHASCRIPQETDSAVRVTWSAVGRKEASLADAGCRRGVDLPCLRRCRRMHGLCALPAPLEAAWNHRNPPVTMFCPRLGWMPAQGGVLPSGDRRERQDSIANRPFCETLWGLAGILSIATCEPAIGVADTMQRRPCGKCRPSKAACRTVSPGGGIRGASYDRAIS